MSSEESSGDIDDNLHFVAEKAEFGMTDRIIVDVEGREVAVFKLDQKYYALANYCVHQGGPLCEGKICGALTTNEDFELEYSLEDQVISCPWHGWEFDIKTGEHLTQTGYKTPMYQVVTKQDNVYINI